MSYPEKGAGYKHEPSFLKDLKRAEGGNVEPIPFSLAKTGDAMSRLEKAGELEGKSDRAGDFAAAKLQRLGMDPQAMIGRSAKYKSGGEVKE